MNNKKTEQIPFDITKFEEEKFNAEIIRFQYLYEKYNDDIAEILEFANLYNKFVQKSNSKWF